MWYKGYRPGMRDHLPREAGLAMQKARSSKRGFTVCSQLKQLICEFTKISYSMWMVVSRWSRPVCGHPHTIWWYAKGELTTDPLLPKNKAACQYPRPTEQFRSPHIACGLTEKPHKKTLVPYVWCLRQRK